MRAIRVSEYGGPDMLRVEDVSETGPAEDEVVVRLDAAGVNMIDIQQRSGTYPVELPFTPGTEGAGVVVAVGDQVGDVRAGDAVAFAGVPGAYAEQVVVPARRLVPVPPDVPTDIAAAVLLQGMTAHYLAGSVVPLEPGDLVVVHSAAGGVGSLLTQLAARRGLRVIGTTSSEQKAAIVGDAGASDVVIRGRDDLRAVVHERSDGAGARAIFDSIGKATFEDSLASLARRGCLVVFGQSSGAVPPFDVRRLQAAGSVYLTRPGLADYTAERDELLRRAGEIFSLVASRSLSIHIHARYPLSDAAEAHRDLESGTTSGKLLLLPGGWMGRSPPEGR